MRAGYRDELGKSNAYARWMGTFVRRYHNYARRDGDAVQVFAVSLFRIRPKRNGARANQAFLPLLAIRPVPHPWQSSQAKKSGRATGHPVARPAWFANRSTVLSERSSKRQTSEDDRRLAVSPVCSAATVDSVAGAFAAIVVSAADVAVQPVAFWRHHFAWSSFGLLCPVASAAAAAPSVAERIVCRIVSGSACPVSRYPYLGRLDVPLVGAREHGPPHWPDHFP